MKVTGLIYSETPTSANRIYPLELLHKIADHINDQEYSFYGELDHPEGKSKYTVNLSHVSHKIYDAVVEDNELNFEVEVLNTPKGNLLRLILSDVVFRPRGIGSTDDNGRVNIDDYQIISFDAILGQNDTFKDLLK